MNSENCYCCSSAASFGYLSEFVHKTNPSRSPTTQSGLLMLQQFYHRSDNKTGAGVSTPDAAEVAASTSVAEATATLRTCADAAAAAALTLAQSPQQTPSAALTDIPTMLHNLQKKWMSAGDGAVHTV